MSLDKKLLELVGNTSTPTEETEIIEKYVIPKATKEDITDLVENAQQTSFKRKLTGLDYLILNDYTEGIDNIKIASQRGVSERYIHTLLRSDAGTAFTEEVTATRKRVALEVSTNMVTQGVMKYQEQINKYFDSGKTDLGLSMMFGKLSLMEVQQMLHKQQDNVVDEGTDALKQLFLNIAVQNNNG